MAILRLAWKSLLNRRFNAGLILLSIALSVSLLVGVERLRHEAQTSFANTLSGTDLIVGARGGSVQLLLYAVFRLGQASHTISWSSYQAIAAHPRVAWTVPLSLGDSHRGYPVLGTDLGYFEHYRFARDRRLEFAAGGPFTDLYDAVLGAEVAAALGYRLGDSIVVGHGTGKVSFTAHADKPFRVAGILERTGTPVDRTVHVRLEAIEAIHLDWHSGAPVPGHSTSAEEARHLDLTPRRITAALVGVTSRAAAFRVQRFVNTYPDEPLSAILPGVALSELWGLVGVAENVLQIISASVVLIGMLGMLTVLLTSLAERRREMAILRSVGARPWQLFALIMGEAGFLTLLGLILGLGLLYIVLGVAQPLIQAEYGLSLSGRLPSLSEWRLLGAVAVAGFAVGAIPAYRAYRLSLVDGLSMRT
ncbi:ABC transporter permease [Allochromatium vinosum]|uniref:ABC3 transporter permease protein domain-containing protein n=1 Tax=Allochromatium vinosum (strain ATCC 17899 / DSM 180 / NBRC 103801 / NCIMB 10441 / D) TaxID=572477 RepID=D3RMP4_ALLVD|nr:ABC transporter permease [Allochromatium vinosum]ADC63182.1 protein of unknown function DUF214 [Allochromatium vinosum DSM 180]